MELALDVELDPMEVGIGDVVAEVPGELAEERGVFSDLGFVEIAKLRGETPASRSVQVVELAELHSDGVRGVVATAQLGGERQQAVRCGVAIARVDFDALRLKRKRGGRIRAGGHGR